MLLLHCHTHNNSTMGPFVIKPSLGPPYGLAASNLRMI